MYHVIWTILKLVSKNDRFLLFCFFNVAVKCNLGHLQDFQKVGLFLDPTENKKENKFKIRRQFQYLTTRPNDMTHTQVTIGKNNSN